MKMGARHPIFLGETAGIADFIQNDARYVKGGYKRLEKILKKVDEFEAELKKEKVMWETTRYTQLVACDKGEKDVADQKVTRDGNEASNLAKTRSLAGEIIQLKGNIAYDLSLEGAEAQGQKDDILGATKHYKEYWSGTEERHQVRNVLMQALWLICYGFANFRHTQYCTNIRQQPDYDEKPDSDTKIYEELQATDVGKSEYIDLESQSKLFSETMDPVWQQQKMFDTQTVNSEDGDPDMNKGFVANRAPWGVDPGGMEYRIGADPGAVSQGAATFSPTTAAPTTSRRLLSQDEDEEELGESNEEEAQNMTNEEMSARLSFLIDGTNIPRHISVPINALIQSVESDDTAVTEGLVEALVNMDVEEGQDQSKADYAFYNDMNTKRKEMYSRATLAISEKKSQLSSFTTIESKMSEQLAIYDSEVSSFADMESLMSQERSNREACELANIEAEATLEAVVEEETNLMRLNSLLRFLVIGDQPDCSDATFDNCERGTAPGGSCTWRNRGVAPAGGAVAANCETETGQDIACNYDNSYPDSPAYSDVYAKVHTGDSSPARGTFRSSDVFCACEYGRFGRQDPNAGCTDCACDLYMCPGYGRIQYPGNDQPALKINGVPIGPQYYPTGSGIQVEGTYVLGNVCAGIRWEGSHGACDVSTGKCTWCFNDAERTSGDGANINGFGKPAADDTTGGHQCGSCRSECLTSGNIDGSGNVVTSADWAPFSFTAEGNCGADAWANQMNGTPKLCDDGTNKFVCSEVVKAFWHHGTYEKCENKYVYKVPTDADPDKYHFERGTESSTCSGDAGTAEKWEFSGAYTGDCVCTVQSEAAAWSGKACEFRMCNDDEDGAKKGKWYPFQAAVNCQGRGVCIEQSKGDDATYQPGECSCDQYSTGATCKEKRCPGYDPTVGREAQECGEGTGTCNLATGRCQCAAGVSCGHQGMNGRCPGACIYNDCENNCGGSDIDGDGSHGLCDRFSGVCMCTGGEGSPGDGAPDYNFNGPACRKVTKGADANRDAQHAVWTKSMDQWGWSTCKKGYLVTGMQTDLLSSMDALYNLDRAKCQRPYEAGEVMPSAIEPSRCYHENWWKQMDSKGGKFCRRNYFIAGFFRSHCNSLYCIEMAKCCSVKRSIWKDCKWTAINDWTSNNNGFSIADDVAGVEDQFIAGVFRDETHTLQGITHIRQCSPLWWGQVYKFKTRFDD